MINSKVKSEFLQKLACCSEYAYREDTNYPIRNQMEDSHYYKDNCFQDGTTCLFAVFDGHGGTDVVEYITKILPETFLREFKQFNTLKPNEYFEQIFKKVDDQLKLVGAAEIGATCCLTLLRKEDNKRKCYIANLGDTRAVMNIDGKAVRMTVDHKGIDPEEQVRVKREGGTIVRGRVMGQLAVTRAFGDLDLKTVGVSVKPDLKVQEITPQCKYLIMASDGLWDVVDDQKAIDITKGLKNSDEMTKELLQFALKNGSRDNISILIVMF
ncbi:unnamed protein product [Paramecium primaurelia]|uniref:protein-serine/threonine phosphatase n=1 Tax=Paramecium primaurelia TaxID=5886 RepID=A0A8S1LL78_PARPR|nr:unnamed protein product [Paramecium primaurelia]